MAEGTPWLDQKHRPQAGQLFASVTTALRPYDGLLRRSVWGKGRLRADAFVQVVYLAL
jgi:hypothetical protein